MAPTWGQGALGWRWGWVSGLRTWREFGLGASWSPVSAPASSVPTSPAVPAPPGSVSTSSASAPSTCTHIIGTQLTGTQTTNTPTSAAPTPPTCPSPPSLCTHIIGISTPALAPTPLIPAPSTPAPWDTSNVHITSTQTTSTHSPCHPPQHPDPTGEQSRLLGPSAPSPHPKIRPRTLLGVGGDVFPGTRRLRAGGCRRGMPSWHPLISPALQPLSHPPTSNGGGDKVSQPQPCPSPWGGGGGGGWTVPGDTLEQRGTAD